MNSRNARLSPENPSQEPTVAESPTISALHLRAQQDPINILIVDDEPKNLTVLETVLDDPRYRLVRAESADQALLSLVVEDFALLILDIQMPGMTGFELAHMIKERRKTAQVPIIFLTAYYNEDQHILEGYGTGAVDYLQKPVNAAVLRSKVSVFAELHLKSREIMTTNRLLLTEIAERRLAEEQLRELNGTLEQRISERTALLQESEFNYRSLFEGAGVGSVEASFHNGRFTKVNKRYCDLVGYTQEELIGHLSLIDLTHPEDREAYLSALARFSRGETDSFEIEKRSIRKGGEAFWMHLTCTALRDGAGNIVRLLSSASDITARKRAEEQLRQREQEFRALAEAADAANLAKDQFLAALSHELRTPLTPVRMAVSVWERCGDTLPADFHNDLAMIRRNIDLECRLIDDMLDLNRIAHGKLDLQFATVDLNEESRHAVMSVESDAAAKQIGLSFAADSTNANVLGDAARLQQILWNLLKNAVKFTPPSGSVSVRTYNSAAGDVCVEVSDTGVGIEADRIHRIFNSFEQGGAHVTRRFGGLGLGLSISKALCDMHGGTLTAQSEGSGRGATFVLTLRLATPVNSPASMPPGVSPPAMQRSAESGQHAVRVLLVEDHQDTSRIMKRLLTSLGYDVHPAACVADAIAAADQQAFDLILSDIGLPDGSGYELMRHISAKRPTKGIALSGFGMEEDIRRGTDAGFSAYLTKPINLEQLEMTIQRVMGKTARPKS